MEKRERWRREVDAEVAARGEEVLPGGVCGAPKRRHNGGGTCDRLAGHETTHLGVGRCRSHGGNSPRENTRGAWLMAHEIARALNVTPWEALTGEVRRSAGTVAWLDRKIAEAPDDDSLMRERTTEEGPGYGFWLKLRERERDRLARVSKMAIDAGVARQIVNQFEMQGETIARLVTTLLGDLGLTDEQEELATRLMSRELLRLEEHATADRVIEGETVNVPARRTRVPATDARGNPVE